VNSWSTEAKAVVRQACERHGGHPAWKGTRSLLLEADDLSGLLPWVKGAGSTFRFPPRIRVFPHEARTVFEDFPGPGDTGVFEGDGSVSVRRRDGGVDGTPGLDHRASFGRLSKYRRWRPVDALYFFGYAVLHYHSLPFTLTEGEFLGMRRRRTHDGDRTEIRVRFPRSRITHCPVQTFHFDESGLLRRHDYTADVIGSWARGAHLWEDYRDVDGLLVAMQRRVVPRIGGATFPVVALHARFVSATREKSEADGRDDAER